MCHLCLTISLRQTPCTKLNLTLISERAPKYQYIIKYMIYGPHWCLFVNCSVWCSSFDNSVCSHITRIYCTIFNFSKNRVTYLCRDLLLKSLGSSSTVHCLPLTLGVRFSVSHLFFLPQEGIMGYSACSSVSKQCSG